METECDVVHNELDGRVFRVRRVACNRCGRQVRTARNVTIVVPHPPWFTMQDDGGDGKMVGEGGQRMAELLRGPDQLSISKPICPSPTASVVAQSAPPIAKGPLQAGQTRNASREILAQAGNPTSVAGETIRRQITQGRSLVP